MTGDVVKKIRMSLGLSQPKFAELIGVTLKAVQCWEQGYGEPNKVTARVIELLPNTEFIQLWKGR